MNSEAYYALGTWFRSVTSSSPRLMFSIVCAGSSTRKRTFGKRRGRWWSASSWCPGPRRSTPRRGRRRCSPRSSGEIFVTGAEDQYQKQKENCVLVDSALEVKMVAMKCGSEKDQEELEIDNLNNIPGAEEQHQQQSPEVEAVECDLVFEEKEMLNARKLALLIKSQFCVAGWDTEVQAGLHAGVQPVQDEEVWPWDGGEGHEHGQPDVLEDLGDGQEGEQLGQVHGQDQPEQDSQTIATIGDGFRSEYRKIARASRKYCGASDGLLQMKFSDFVIGGNLGGGSLNIMGSKKRKVEHEQKLRVKKCRLGG